MECSDLGVRNNVDFEGQHWSALLLTACSPLQVLDMATEDSGTYLKKGWGQDTWVWAVHLWDI